MSKFGLKTEDINMIKEIIVKSCWSCTEVPALVSNTVHLYVCFFLNFSRPRTVKKAAMTAWRQKSLWRPCYTILRPSSWSHGTTYCIVTVHLLSSKWSSTTMPGMMLAKSYGFSQTGPRWDDWDLVWVFFSVKTRAPLNSLAPVRPGCHFKTAIFNLVLSTGIFISSDDNALRWMSWTSPMISQHCSR